jgi:hypothetical protein
MVGEGVLRPEIKIEVAAFPVRRPPIPLTVRSFCAQAAGRPAEVLAIPCVALVETAAEKFVALTRRTGAVFAGVEPPDDTLVRHIYDLFRLDGRYDGDDGVVLARETMAVDAEQRGYDAYKADPASETLATVARMSTDPGVRRDYEALMDGMVYGQQPDFDEAMAVVGAFASRL